MRIALIDNGSKLREQLEVLLSAHEVTEFSYPEAATVLEGGFDAIILSGSSLPSIVPIVSNPEKLQAEIKLIQETKVPLLGICYGNELVAFAFGGTLTELTEPAHGIKPVRLIGTDSLTEGIPSSFEAYESHHWVVKTLPSDFLLLAQSDTGAEIIRHASRPIFGFQFHPEKLASEPALKLLGNFLKLAQK